MILHARLADYATPLIGTERDDEAENIILSLAAFTDVKLDECMRSMDSQSCFWPSLPFHRAPADVRDELLACVESGEGNRNHLDATTRSP